MNTNEQRLGFINQYPDDTIFIVRAPNNMVWKRDDRGYSEDITEARLFTKPEIINGLTHNGYMDKTIEVFTSQATI